MSERQLVVFGLGSEEFGIDIARVREIVRLQNITAIPGSSEFVEGIINLRGQIVPIINLGKRFGMKNEKTDDSQRRIIVVNIEDRNIGVLVDGVSEILRISNDLIEETPPVVSGGIPNDCLGGIAKIESKKRFVIILNLERLFPSSGRHKNASDNATEPEPIACDTGVPAPETTETTPKPVSPVKRTPKTSKTKMA